MRTIEPVEGTVMKFTVRKLTLDGAAFWVERPVDLYAVDWHDDGVPPLQRLYVSVNEVLVCAPGEGLRLPDMYTVHKTCAPLVAKDGEQLPMKCDTPGLPMFVVVRFMAFAWNCIGTPRLLVNCTTNLWLLTAFVVRRVCEHGRSGCMLHDDARYAAGGLVVARTATAAMNTATIRNAHAYVVRSSTADCCFCKRIVTSLQKALQGRYLELAILRASLRL